MILGSFIGSDGLALPVTLSFTDILWCRGQLFHCDGMRVDFWSTDWSRIYFQERDKALSIHGHFLSVVRFDVLSFSPHFLPFELLGFLNYL